MNPALHRLIRDRIAEYRDALRLWEGSGEDDDSLSLTVAQHEAAITELSWVLEMCREVVQ